jgi:hypothetical protein
MSATWRIGEATGPVRMCYVSLMSPITARVQQGRLVVDAPTDLPEGTVLNLVVDDEGDDLQPGERAALDAALSRAWAQVQRGEGVSSGALLARLRHK